VFSGGWRLIHHAQRQGVPAALGLTTEEWVRDRLGGYVRLAIEDRREAAAEMAEEGLSQREIAGVLGVDQKTISNDLRGEEDSSRNGEEVAGNREESKPDEEFSSRRKKQQTEPEEEEPIPTAGKGMNLANQAINILGRIPKDDPQRAFARKYLLAWIKDNLEK
jgi:hypothetical protein